MTDEGAALIETALVLPVVILVLVGGLILGLATVDNVRLERVTGDAAPLTEADAHALVATVGGRVTCWWRGEGSGGCYDDHLDVARTQIVTVGRRWVYPTGTVTPTARATVPTGEQP